MVKNFKLICMGRGEGKTKEIIEVAAERGATIICHNDNHRKDIKHRALKMGLILREPLTYSEFLGGFFHVREHKCFCIDDLDAFIATALYSSFGGIPVVAASFGPDNIDPKLIDQLLDADVVQKQIAERGL